MFSNGFAKGKTCIYFLFTFWQLKFSIIALWGQRLLEAGAASFCTSAAECQFSLRLSHTRLHHCFFHFTDPEDLTSGQWLMVSMPLYIMCLSFLVLLWASAMGTVGVKLVGEKKTAFCADLEDFWSLIKLGIHLWEEATVWRKKPFLGFPCLFPCGSEGLVKL